MLWCLDSTETVSIRKSNNLFVTLESESMLAKLLSTPVTSKCVFHIYHSVKVSPQGSGLGPVLFSPFHNSFRRYCSKNNSNLPSCADNTTSHLSINLLITDWPNASLLFFNSILFSDPNSLMIQQLITSLLSTVYLKTLHEYWQNLLVFFFRKIFYLSLK